jgi:hypothetical protein
MEAIISRTKIINKELSASNGFEMAKAFGVKSKKKPKTRNMNSQCKSHILLKCKIRINR